VKGALLLFRKELLQAVRDRRTVFMTVAFPLLFYPLLFGFIGDLVGREQARLATLVPQVLVVMEGEVGELAQALAEEETLQAFFYPDLDQALADLRRGMGEVALWVRREPARGELGYSLTLYYDATSQEAQAAMAKVKGFLQGFFQKLTLERLSAMGIDPESVQPPFTVEAEDIGGREAFGRMLLSRILPYFLVLSILFGALGFGAEITAGEKERGTIATLLSSRLSREEIVLGKFLAVLTVSLASTVLSATGLLIGIRSFGARLDAAAGLSLATAGWILLVLIPLAIVLSAAVLIVGSFARTQKEASVYLLPLYMVIILLGISVMMGSTKPQGAFFAIPVAGSMAAIQQAISGSITPGELAWTLFSSLALGTALLAVSVRIFRSEKVLFRI